MAKISISSLEAERDKQYLGTCNGSLAGAVVNLRNAQKALGAWKGNAAAQCEILLNDFIKQLDGMIEKDERAVKKIDSIVATYREADKRLAGGGW
ncbi:MAG: WXG100 family type VII secretion target [Oscillospiraceae bacterium]|jgi:hypothetical protein|nr:WXG100 family type VII secretion target [Oscillospiraceae bacterium]